MRAGFGVAGVFDATVRLEEHDVDDKKHPALINNGMNRSLFRKNVFELTTIMLTAPRPHKQGV